MQEISPPTLEQERFLAEVWLNEEKLGTGTGQSKKAAEQAAAKEAFLITVGKEEPRG